MTTFEAMDWNEDDTPTEDTPTEDTPTEDVLTNIDPEELQFVDWLRG